MNLEDNLENLATAHFGNLTAAETKAVRAAAIGELAICGSSGYEGDPTNDPLIADTWGTERHVRADVLRWLCVQKKERVDPAGIQILGARIIGELRLSHATVGFPLAFACCYIDSDLVFEGSRTRSLSFQRTRFRSILADGAVVQGAVFVQNHSYCVGSLRFPGAQIEGQFSCCHSSLDYTIAPSSQGGFASLILDGATVGGAVLLRGLQAKTEVRMPRARIGAELDCQGGSFLASRDTAGHYVSPALNADGVTVGGSILLRNGFRADGLVTLHAAHIGTNLDCIHAQFNNSLQEAVIGTGESLIADLAIVQGSVILSDNFQATGLVRFISSRIAGDLLCTQATIQSGLVVERAKIDGTLYWRDITLHPTTQLDLMNSTASSLCDDEASWPNAGYLQVYGFVYERIALSSPRAVPIRLRWLARMRQFSRQPYQQLAQALSNDGDDAGARRALYEMEHVRGQTEDHGWFAYFRNIAFRLTVGYGYYPRRALEGLLLLVVVGYFFYWGGYTDGSIVPADKDAYWSVKSTNELPPYYERFHPSLYSLENSFPLIRLGQADRWQPDPSPTWQPRGLGSRCRLILSVTSPSVMELVRIFQTCLGWFLATMGIAAVTGIVRKE